jgi:hypothetical protein
LEVIMIGFWISIDSTYSYLSVIKLNSVEEASGVSFRWRLVLGPSDRARAEERPVCRQAD